MTKDQRDTEIRFCIALMNVLDIRQVQKVLEKYLQLRDFGFTVPLINERETPKTFNAGSSTG